MREYKTLTEIMAQYDVSRNLLYERIAAGVFPGIEMRGKTWHIPTDEITELALRPKRKREKVERTVIYTDLVTVYAVDGHECISSPDAALLLGISRTAFGTRVNAGHYEPLIYRNERHVSKRVYRLDRLMIWRE